MIKFFYCRISLCLFLILNLSFLCFAEEVIDRTNNELYSNKNLQENFSIEEFEQYFQKFFDIFYQKAFHAKNLGENSEIINLYSQLDLVRGNTIEEYKIWREYFERYKLDDNLSIFLKVEVLKNLSIIIDDFALKENAENVINYFNQYEAIIREAGGLGSLFADVDQYVNRNINSNEFNAFKESILNAHFNALVYYAKSSDIAYSYPLLDELKKHQSFRSPIATEYLRKAQSMIAGMHMDTLLKKLGYGYQTSDLIKQILFSLFDNFKVRRNYSFEEQKEQFSEYFDFIHNYIHPDDKLSIRNLSLYGLFTDSGVLDEFQNIVDNWDSYEKKDKGYVLDSFLCQYYSFISWLLLTSHGFEAHLIVVEDTSNKAFLNLPTPYYHIAIMVKISDQQLIFVDPVNREVGEPFTIDNNYKEDDSRQDRFLLINSSYRNDLFLDFQVVSPKFSVASFYVALGRMMLRFEQIEKAKSYCRKAVEYFPENWTGQMCLDVLNSK